MDGIEQQFPQSHLQSVDSKLQQQPPPASPPDLTPNRDPQQLLDPPPSDDDALKQILTLEFQNLALKEAFDARVLNLLAWEDEQTPVDEDGELKRAVGQELYRLVLKQAISEAIQSKSEVDEAKFQALSHFIDEVLDRNGLKRNGAVIETDHEFGRPVGTRVFAESGDVDSVKEFDEWNGGIEEEKRSENGEEERDFESVYHVGEQSGAAGIQEDGKFRRYHYPLRPDAEDCSYYMRTGACKFGSNCKFNHPLKRKNQTFKQTLKQKDENLDRPGQTECKYYLSSGGCKYGKACKYSHSRGKPALPPVVEFNFLGLPIRQGEKECPFYMRTGSCKYGSNCRFNHPDPTAVVGGDSPVRYGNGGPSSLPGASQTTMSSWSSPRALNEPTPYVPMMYPPNQGIPSPNPEWNGYQAPVYPTSERSLPTPPAFALNSSAGDTSLYTHHQQQMLVGDFPERPGQPECSYFLKTGDCKYRSACKFHHPKSRISKTSQSVLSDKGLPLRPDQNICSHYSRYGICKYGPACKYDHPVNYINPVFVGGSGPDGPRTTAGSGMGRESLIQQPV